MKKILSLVLVVALALSLAACGGKDQVNNDPTEQPTEASREKLVIGYTLYEPMNYQGEDGALTGFDTEFAEAFCAKMGYEPEFIIIDWDNKFLELDAESIDCVWNGMTITEEALLNASVSNPYVKNAQVVVMNKDAAANYTTIESLVGLKFTAEAGSAGAAAIESYALDPNYTAVQAQTDALLEVASGASDACIIDITMANAMTGEGTNYDSLTIVQELDSEEYGVAFKKGSPLTEEFNNAMAEMMADGTLDALAEKYSLTLVK